MLKVDGSTMNHVDVENMSKKSLTHYNALCE
jgi:hypothetical protein